MGHINKYNIMRKGTQSMYQPSNGKNKPSPASFNTLLEGQTLAKSTYQPLKGSSIQNKKPVSSLKKIEGVDIKESGNFASTISNLKKKPNKKVI